MGYPPKKRPKSIQADNPELEQQKREMIRLKRKERKQKLKEKRARLVIRNLPFDTTEQNLRNHFQQFGELDDVKILKTENGLMLGCAFVQFKLVQQAAKARHHTNYKPFLGREILVDFAQAKDKYINTLKNEEVQVKEEPIDSEEIKKVVEGIKKENDRQQEEDLINESGVLEDISEVKEVKNTTKYDDEGDQSVDNNEEKDEDVTEEISKAASGTEPESNKSSESETMETDDSSEEDEDQVQSSEDNVTREETNIVKKAHFESNDVVEGKTIFIKNVPFTATNDDLKNCMSQFGPTYYALICIDKFTEHSKGTAFVKFINKEDAEKALTAGTELTLFDSVLDTHIALGRGELQQKAAANEERTRTPKDTRNLYLVKEGVILAGSKAAEGVSASDMAKRLQLEQYKTQMLRNLNMFISRERLIIHNLPPSWDDDKLRNLIKNNSPKNSVIKEARVIRDIKNIEPNGLGRSKEFGFVSFKRHDDALVSLRNLNNNPNVFSTYKRPIVAFSIENRAMINTKQKRLEKSRLHNPKSKHFDPLAVKEDKERKRKRAELTDNVLLKSKWKQVQNPNGTQSEKSMKGTSDAVKTFTGVTAKPGIQKMRSRYNLKSQAKQHYENLKKEKKKLKFTKKTFKEKLKEFTKQPKQKINSKKEHDSFAKLVASYKTKLLNVPQIKRKWFEGQD